MPHQFGQGKTNGQGHHGLKVNGDEERKRLSKNHVIEDQKWEVVCTEKTVFIDLGQFGFKHILMESKKKGVSFDEKAKRRLISRLYKKGDKVPDDLPRLSTTEKYRNPLTEVGKKGFYKYQNTTIQLKNVNFKTVMVEMANCLSMQTFPDEAPNR